MHSSLNYQRDKEKLIYLFLNYRRNEDKPKNLFLNHRRKEEKTNAFVLQLLKEGRKPKYLFLNYRRNDENQKYSFLNYRWFDIATLYSLAIRQQKYILNKKSRNLVLFTNNIPSRFTNHQAS